MLEGASPIIEPMVTLTSPLSQKFGGEDLSLKSIRTMNMRSELITLCYAYANAFGDNTPVVILGDELHGLPGIQEYIWASITTYTGLDTRPAIFGVTQTAVTEKTEKPINWIRGYDWETGAYGVLTPKILLSTLNQSAANIGLHTAKLKVLGLDEYDRVFIGLRNGVYKDHLVNNLGGESKVSDILEAGLILTYYPPELVAKYSLNHTHPVNPSEVTNRIAREGLVTLLNILNSKKNDQGVGVKEIRFFADFKDYLKYDITLKQWVYVGGYDSGGYDANEFAQQTTGVMTNAECWGESAFTKFQIDVPKKYEKSFSLYKQRKQPPKSCIHCPLMPMCREYATNIESQSVISTPDISSVLGLLARYLARIRAGILHNTALAAKKGNPMYYLYSPTKLRSLYHGVDPETEGIQPLQGLLEIPFSFEGYQRYMQRNYGRSSGAVGFTQSQRTERVSTIDEKGDPFGPVPAGLFAVDTEGSDRDYLEDDEIQQGEPVAKTNYWFKDKDKLGGSTEPGVRIETNPSKPVRFIEELSLVRKRRTKTGDVLALVDKIPPNHPLHRILQETLERLNRRGKRHNGIEGFDFLVQGDKVIIRMYFNEVVP